MISLSIILLILAMHFVADFILQSDWMAVNKSKNWLALGSHVLIYGAALMLFTGFAAIGWVIVNAILHFATDAITSRINAKLWAEKKVGLFFIGIGADQFLHYACLFSTFVWFFA